MSSPFWCICLLSLHGKFQVSWRTEINDHKFFFLFLNTAVCRWFLQIQLQETYQCLMKWESWNNHDDVSRNAKSLCKQRFLPPSWPWQSQQIRVRSWRNFSFFLTSCILTGEVGVPELSGLFCGCLKFYSDIIKVMFWFIFWTNAVVTHITHRLTPTTYIKSWRSTIRVEMDLWALSWRESMIGLCKIAAAKMYWCSWFGSLPRHLVPMRKISCWNYVIKTDLSDL